MARDDIVRTAHSARLRLVHGEDCEGCQDIGVRMALHIVHLAGWRIVRGGIDVSHTAIVVHDEWTPDGITKGLAGTPESVLCRTCLARHRSDDDNPLCDRFDPAPDAEGSR